MLPEPVFCGTVKGQRKIGRPRTGWRGNVDYDTETMGSIPGDKATLETSN